jgi:hypothetical protein
MKNIVGLTALAAIIVGCATAPDFGTQAAKLDDSMRYSESESMYARAIGAGENLPRDWHNLGVLYLHEAKSYTLLTPVYLKRAARAFAMGARYGNTQSQAALVQMNMPVPTADLAQAGGSTRGDLAFIAIMGTLAVAGRGNTDQASPTTPILSNPAIDCTSSKLGTFVRTSCR